MATGSLLSLLQNSPKSPKFSTKTFRGFFMSTFFQQTAQAMIAKHIDRFPPVEAGAGD